MNMMVEHLTGMYAPENPLWVPVLHGRLADKAETFAQMLQARLNVSKLEILRISPILGVHTGPGIVGATVTPMRLMDGFA